MVFTVLGAVAELERSLIVERVRAGLRNAKAKGRRLGRPRVACDAARIAALRSQGFGWKKIAREMGCGVSTVLRARPTRVRQSLPIQRLQVLCFPSAPESSRVVR
jgi:DNA invertase Pin-like site-specific DNA recombinase